MASRRNKWVVTAEKYLTAAEIGQLKRYLSRNSQTVRARVTAFIVAMLLGTGMRASEFCGLSVDRCPGVLGVDAIKVKGKGGRERQIWIRPELSGQIAEFVENVRPQFVRRPMSKKDLTAPLLLTERGGPYDRRLMWQRVRNVCKRAGIAKRMYPHGLRHSYATWLYYWADKDLLLVQKQMGHADINTTTVYAKLIDDEVVERLGKADILSVRSALVV